MNMQVQTINGLRPTDVWFLANPRYSTTKQWQALIGSGLTLGDKAAKRVDDCATRPWSLPRILRLVRHLNDAAKCEAVEGYLLFNHGSQQRTRTFKVYLNATPPSGAVILPPRRCATIGELERSIGKEQVVYYGRPRGADNSGMGFVRIERVPSISRFSGKSAHDREQPFRDDVLYSSTVPCAGKKGNKCT
jgi:hypothetical protein